MICRHCARLIKRCDSPGCPLGYVHVVTDSHLCEHGAINDDETRAAEPDPAT